MLFTSELTIYYCRLSENVSRTCIDYDQAIGNIPNTFSHESSQVLHLKNYKFAERQDCLQESSDACVLFQNAQALKSWKHSQRQ